MYSPDKMMGSKGLHGAPITAPGCFPSGRYSPPPYRAAPDPMPPPPRRCMPNSTVSRTTRFSPNLISRPIISAILVRNILRKSSWFISDYSVTQRRTNWYSRWIVRISFFHGNYIFLFFYIFMCIVLEERFFSIYIFNVINVKIKFWKLNINLTNVSYHSSLNDTNSE